MSAHTAIVRSSLIAALLAGAAFAVAAQAQSKAPADPSVKANAAAEMAFAGADKNNDGKLSRDEAAALPGVAAKFDQLDKNKDGVLSIEEFSVGYMPTK